MNFRGGVHKWDSPMEPGDYTIPFEFTLPSRMPASILYNDKTTWQRPKAKIRYSVQAIMHSHDGSIMKYKQMIMVHQPPVAFVQDQIHAANKVINSWCCIGKGKSAVQAKFNKNVFYNNEWAGADITVNNSECDLPVKQIEFDVRQILYLKIGWNTISHEREVLANKNNTTIPAHHTDSHSTQMGLNLANIHYKVAPTQLRRVKNMNGGIFSPSTVKKRFPRSKEEMFQLENLAPATHSDIITNNYFLNVNTKFDEGCCVPENDLNLPLTIIPVTYPDSYGFTEPAGYAPTQLSYAKFNLHMLLYI